MIYPQLPRVNKDDPFFISTLESINELRKLADGTIYLCSCTDVVTDIQTATANSCSGFAFGDEDKEERQGEGHGSCVYFNRYKIGLSNKACTNLTLIRWSGLLYLFYVFHYDNGAKCFPFY